MQLRNLFLSLCLVLVRFGTLTTPQTIEEAYSDCYELIAKCHAVRDSIAKVTPQNLETQQQVHILLIHRKLLFLSLFGLWSCEVQLDSQGPDN